LHDESGASMVEYGLMIALIAAACFTAVSSFGTAVSTKLWTITSAF
jgi:Flp pilus assembly pilin Flp